MSEKRRRWRGFAVVVLKPGEALVRDADTGKVDRWSTQRLAGNAGALGEWEWPASQRRSVDVRLWRDDESVR